MMKESSPGISVFSFFDHVVWARDFGWVDPHTIDYVFPSDIWCKINKLLLKVMWMSTHQALLGRLEGFKVSSWFLKIIKLVEYQKMLLFSEKWYPILDPNALIYIPYPRVNCLKTIPFTAAHTYIAHMWQCPPRPGRDVTDDLILKALQSCNWFTNDTGFIRSTDIRRSVYRTLVRPPFGYATQIWTPQSIELITRIERTQRHATKYILKLPFSCTISYMDRLKSLDLLPLTFW